MEHAPNEVPDILAQLQAIGASRANVEPVVRIQRIYRYLYAR